MANKCNLYQIFKFSRCYFERFRDSDMANNVIYIKYLNSVGVISRDHVPIMEPPPPPAAPGDFMRPFLISHMSKQWEMICWTTQNAFLDFYGYISNTALTDLKYIFVRQ